MKIGLIADTHDNLPLIKKAVELFNKYNVEFVLHAGDFIAPFSVKPLFDLVCPWKGVLGNNDGETRGLVKVSKGNISHQPLVLELGARGITLVHEYRKADTDVIVFGHTHTPHIEKQGKQLLVNPGEASGWISGKPSIAVLDLETLSAEIVYL
jgi:putative phosphoesterase